MDLKSRLPLQNVLLDKAAQRRERRIIKELNTPEVRAQNSVPLDVVEFPMGGVKSLEQRRQVNDANELIYGSRPIHTRDLDLSWEKLGIQGRRFLSGGRSARQIEGITGRPAKEPMRFYAGLLHGDPQERVDRLLKGLVTKQNDAGETGMDQAVILLEMPAGSGFNDPGIAATVETLADGSCATVSAQYNNRPSWLSIIEKETGAYMFERLLVGINKLRQERAAKGQSVPKLMVMGESLGSRLMDRTLREHKYDIQDPKSLYFIDNFLLTGLPGGADLNEDLFGDLHYVNGRMDSPKGPFAMVNASVDIAELGPPTEYVIANNAGDLVPNMPDPSMPDPVSMMGKFSAWLFKPSDWAEGASFTPIVSKWKLLKDGPKATHPPPGVWDSSGHNYRGSRVALIAKFAFNDEIDPDIVERTDAYEQQAELSRKRQADAAAEIAKKGK
jgi:hypothetical protein